MGGVRPSIAPTKADFEMAIRLGYGDVVTREGFTIVETYDVLWGPGNAAGLGLDRILGDPFTPTPGDDVNDENEREFEEAAERNAGQEPPTEPDDP